MFIFTTKFNRKKAVAIVLALAVLLIVIILIAANNGKTTAPDNADDAAALSAVVKNNEQRINYLNALGWEVEQTALEEQKVVIPREFTSVYADYNDLQKAQGFNLKNYGGLEAMRYTYKVLNYPGANGTVVADIIVYRNEVIAGDVQSNALDGFMVGLAYPKTDTIGPSASGNPPTDAAPSNDAMMPTEVPDNTAEISPTADNPPDNTADTMPGENAAAEDGGEATQQSA